MLGTTVTLRQYSSLFELLTRAPCIYYYIHKICHLPQLNYKLNYLPFTTGFRISASGFRLQASGLVFQVPKQKISWSLQLTKVKEKYKLHVFIICDHLMLAEQQYWLQSKMKDGNHSYHQNPGALILPAFKHLTTFYDYMYVSWSFCTASSFFLYN